MKTLFDLTGKNILLTGGSGFLAEYFAMALAEAGADLALTYSRNKEKAEELADKVKAAHGTQAIVLPMDVTDQAGVDQAFEDVINKLGGVDVVINNAAIDPKFDPQSSANDRLFENYPEEAMQQSVQVNMLGPWRVAKTAVRHMLQSGDAHQIGGRGNIINISSIYGVVPPHQDIYPAGTQKPVDYGMTKAAAQYLTRYIAATYGQQDIRSNALIVGGVLKGHDEEFQKKYGQYSMFGRMTLPEEVGAPLVFLASDASQGTTGHLLTVDGGFSAW